MWEGEKYLGGGGILRRGYKRAVDERRIVWLQKKGRQKIFGLRDKKSRGRQIKDPPRAADTPATPLVYINLLNFHCPSLPQSFEL